VTSAYAGTEPEPPAAPAAPPDFTQAPLRPGKWLADCEGLPFGGDRDAMLAFERRRVDAELRPRLAATPDIRQRDLLQAEAARSVTAFAETRTAFDGQHTGYDVSILSGEFRHGAGQSLLFRDRGRARLYFLFSQGRLWKLLVRQPAGEPFADVLAELQALYGPPTSVRERSGFADEATAAVPEAAAWSDATMSVTVSDQSQLYAAYLVTWTAKGMVAGADLPSGAADTQSLDAHRRFRTEDALREITGPADAPTDIVDQILGGRPAVPVAPEPPEPKPTPSPKRPKRR